MAARQCPRCGLFNVDTAERCDCGRPFPPAGEPEQGNFSAARLLGKRFLVAAPYVCPGILGPVGVVVTLSAVVPSRQLFAGLALVIVAFLSPLVFTMILDSLPDDWWPPNHD